MKICNQPLIRNIALLLLLAPASVMAEYGTALKADTLRAEPYSDAKSLSTIAKGESVNILSKKGSWLQVKSNKNTGWVRLFSVKRGSASANNQIKGVIDVASGRAGSGQVISTTGIRGLSAEDLTTAKYNEAEMQSLDSYTLTISEGQKFANEGKLKAIKFAYLKGAK
ncbi:MAG: SH3 domain-containing protein [Methylophilaceae bacterium]